MSFTLTAEQEEIISHVTTSTDNLLINARAGSAKTTTLIQIAEALPADTILSLAFNKKIKEEMKLRMPSNVTSMTLNGIGYNAWRRFLKKPVRFFGGKTYVALKAEIEKLDKREADEAWRRFSETMKGVAKSKQVGYIPEASAMVRPLVDEDEFYDHQLEYEATELQRALINRIATKSWREMMSGTLDFDDMLLGPALVGVAFDYYDTVLIDEAQDLSYINHILLKKIIRKRTRVVAVGDRHQAIYGFRGAETSSMPMLRKMFDMKLLTLTISFRCSKAVTENARWRAPDMRWPEWAKAGLVLHSGTWGSDDIPDGTAIICRNNAPLFSLAITLLREGRYPELAGRDIIKTVVNKMKKLGKKSMSAEHTLIGIDAWLSAEKLYHRDHKMLEDQAACMRIFVLETANLGEAMVFAEALTQQTGRIYLMTGHKAKGLEFEKVLFLDPQLCSKEGQDPNIKYVIETRAIDTLVYVKSEDYRMKEKEEDNELKVWAPSP